jgi:putative ABC transport system substrate-binding protein
MHLVYRSEGRMNRRGFLGAVLLTSAGGVPVLHAQTVRRIGWLGVAIGPPPVFLERLRELGYQPGSTLLIESRHVGGDLSRLPEAARELVALKPTLIATGAHQSTVALKQATSTISIVFRVGIDPVETGLVASLARPGGNLTGVYQLTAELFGKRFELLRELAPRARRIGGLRQASEKPYEPMIEALARRTGFEVTWLVADTPEEISSVLGGAVAKRLEGFLIGGGPVNNIHRQVVVDAVARTRLPAVYPELPFAEAGGLVAYASDVRAGFVRLADYAHRILQGAKPSDLPVEQAAIIELAVNLKAARTQEITIPQTVLLRATRVIE